MTGNGKSKNDEDERKRARFMWLFVVNVCAVAMGHVILTVYTNGVIRTIERRFGLSSAKTGLLNSCNDIIHICLVIFVGYFGQKYNKPRIICVTIMFSALAGFMMASPHVLFSDYDDRYVQRSHLSRLDNGQLADNSSSLNRPLLPEDMAIAPTTVYSVDHVFPTPTPVVEGDGGKGQVSKTQKSDDIQYCPIDTDGYDDNADDSKCQNKGHDRVHPAFYIFVVAQLISGIGSSGAFTLSMAYVDENSPKHKASIYIGAFMSLFSFAPVTGFMLATLCLKFPENLFSGKKIESSDPSFIGCWWLGYMIGGAYITLCAIPLWWYPTKYTSKRNDLELHVEKFNVVDNKSEKILDQMKGIPKAFADLMSNKLYVINVCQIVCGAYTIYGIFVNLVRYIEIHFNRTAAEGSVIAGVVTAVTGAVGNLTGGALVSRYKLRAIDGIRLVLFSSFVFASGLLIIMNLACPQVEMDMNYDDKLAMNTVINDCNKPCLCTTNRVDYRPICANDNVSYFSPCIAGCSKSVNETYINCKCLKTPATQNSTHSYENGTARNGYCIPPCNLLIPFAITLFVMTFCSAISRVPATMISFRIVKDEERSFALGINSFAINLFGFIPSPLLFGYLIDKSCTLWQVTCKFVGACLMFDVARFRYSIFGGGLSIEIINFFLNFLIFFYLRKMSIGTALLSRQAEVLSECKVKRDSGEKTSKFIEDALTEQQDSKSSESKNDVQLSRL